MILTTSIDHCLLPKRDERKRKKNFVHAKVQRRKGKKVGSIRLAVGGRMGFGWRLIRRDLLEVNGAETI